jgi:hypothetical protein
VSRFNVMPRAYRRQLQAQDDAKIKRITAEAAPITHHPGATAAGDSRKLRGIPAIGRSVRGAIPNTAPGDNLWRDVR